LKKLALILCMAVLGVSAFAQSASAGQVYPRSQWRPIFVTVPAHNVIFRTLGFDANKTVPFFSDKVKSPLDGNTYQFQIVGTNPKNNKVSTTVKYLPIVARIHFPGGVILDPTKPGCGDTVSVANRFFGSPLFNNAPEISNGINVGNTQFIDALQRGEFWSLVKTTNYHMLLAQAKAPKVVDVTAPSGSSSQPGVCAGSGHNLGMIDFFAWGNIVQQLTNQFATTTQLPIVMAYNVVETEGGCCIIGFHGAYGRSGGTQTFATGAYTDAGIFGGGIADIHAWSHEIGEWANDPFINNATPAWGHVGQVGGCQNNLEVGDPLTGTPVVMNFHGFTYHPQEMAYFDWFFRTPAKGTGGEFSYEGTFETSQGVCN
jgi:hypothetical protein